MSGTAVPDEGLLLDLEEMNAADVDPNEKIARVQTGATWGDVDHETQAFGLAVPGGQDPNIGVAGLALGGGVGRLSRKYGLTCDNLRAAELVTAEGDLIRASENDHGASGAVEDGDVRSAVPPSVDAIRENNVDRLDVVWP